MIKGEEREQVRRAYFMVQKSLRQIARELKMVRKRVRKAIEQAEPAVYTLHTPRPAPRLDPFKARIDALLKEAEQMPRTQRYTGHKIFAILQQEGYRGVESSVRLAGQESQIDGVKLSLPLDYISTPRSVNCSE